MEQAWKLWIEFPWFKRINCVVLFGMFLWPNETQNVGNWIDFERQINAGDRPPDRIPIKYNVPHLGSYKVTALHSNENLHDHDLKWNPVGWPIDTYISLPQMQLQFMHTVWTESMDASIQGDLKWFSQ